MREGVAYVLSYCKGIKSSLYQLPALLCILKISLDTHINSIPRSSIIALG